MGSFFFWADGVPVDTSTVGVLNLIGSLGPSAAAIFVVWMFLQFLRVEGDKRDKTHAEIVDRCVAALKENTESNREFVKSIGTICKATGSSRP